MSGFVLDAETTMRWLWEDRCDQRADDLLGELQSELALVPTVWCLQVSQALVEAERAGRLTAAASARFLRLLHTLPISVDRETPARAHSEGLALARTHGLTAVDAAYLELAMREGLPLATTDPTLAEAARLNGVPTR